MAGNRLQSLHRSEGYIYYYRRAIPQSLRPSFANKWEIKRSLKTRDKSLAIIRHNQLNIEVERLFNRANNGETMTEESLESLNLRLRAKIDQEAIDKDGSLDSMLSGIILALRGHPAHAYEDKSKIISPIHIEIDGNQLKAADGSVVSNFIIAIALEYANQINIPPMIDETRFSPKKLVPAEPEQDKYPIDIAKPINKGVEL